MKNVVENGLTLACIGVAVELRRASVRETPLGQHPTASPFVQAVVVTVRPWRPLMGVTARIEMCRGDSSKNTPTP